MVYEREAARGRKGDEARPLETKSMRRIQSSGDGLDLVSDNEKPGIAGSSSVRLLSYFLESKMSKQHS